SRSGARRRLRSRTWLRAGFGRRSALSRKDKSELVFDDIARGRELRGIRRPDFLRMFAAGNKSTLPLKQNIRFLVVIYHVVADFSASTEPRDGIVADFKRLRAAVSRKLR